MSPTLSPKRISTPNMANITETFDQFSTADFANAIGISLYPAQKVLAEKLDEGWTITCAARQYGKTELFAIYCLRIMHCIPNSEIHLFCHFEPLAIDFCSKRLPRIAQRFLGGKRIFGNPKEIPHGRLHSLWTCGDTRQRARDNRVKAT